MERGGIIDVSTTKQFLEAIKRNKPHIRLTQTISLSDGAQPGGRMYPIVIPDGTVIEGGGLVFRCPMQLAGDVTIRNSKLQFNSTNALGSVIHREIFLAGHHLILEDVDTFLRGGDNSLGGLGGTEKEMTVYGGAYPNIGEIGQKAQLTVIGTGSQFEGIYMGHDGSVAGGVQAYTGEAEVSLNAKTVVKQGLPVDKNSNAAV